MNLSVKDISHEVYNSELKLPSENANFRDIRLFQFVISGEIGSTKAFVKITNATSLATPTTEYFQVKVITEFICEFGSANKITEYHVLQMVATSHDYLAAVQFIKLKEIYGVARIPQLIPIEFVKEKIYPLIATEIQNAQKSASKERNWQVVFGDNIETPPSQSKNTL